MKIFKSFLLFLCIGISNQIKAAQLNSLPKTIELVTDTIKQNPVISVVAGATTALGLYFFYNKKKSQRATPKISKETNYNTSAANAEKLKETIKLPLPTQITVDSEEEQMRRILEASKALALPTEPPAYGGFARNPTEYRKAFEGQGDVYLGELHCKSFHKNSLPISQTKTAQIVQLGVIPQTMDTCLWHALKNALLIEQQIKGASRFNEWYEKLEKNTLDSSKKWRGPEHLDEFLEENKESTFPLSKNISALSNDPALLRLCHIGITKTAPQIIAQALQQSQNESFYHTMMFTGSSTIIQAAHWYLLTTYQNITGQRTYIVTDSKEQKNETGDIIASNKKRTEQPEILQLIRDIEEELEK